MTVLAAFVILVVVDDLYYRTLLYDFYGELLTEHRRKIVEAVLFDDLSLAEAGEQYGITRQGVHDLLGRSFAQLSSYEEKLGLIAAFLSIRQKADQIKEYTSDETISKLCEEIIGAI